MDKTYSVFWMRSFRGKGRRNEDFILSYLDMEQGKGREFYLPLLMN